jgi:1-deoxy-D-xylulose-5-phosphate reductoisomerase
MACILNAANEIAVEEFLKGNLTFPGIWAVNEQMMEKSVYIVQPTLDDYMATDCEVRAHALEMVSALQLKY